MNTRKQLGVIPELIFKVNTDGNPDKNCYINSINLANINPASVYCELYVVDVDGVPEPLKNSLGAIQVTGTNRKSVDFKPILNHGESIWGKALSAESILITINSTIKKY